MQQSTQSALTIHATADGGILGSNPGGRSYGSFYVNGTVHRRTYGGGRGHTNNTAEVQTAVECLYFLAETVRWPHLTHVVIHTDSMLCVNWINRRRNPRSGQVFRLVELLEKFRRQAKAFASVRMEWHPREKSVALLGH